MERWKAAVLTKQLVLNKPLQSVFNHWKNMFIDESCSLSRCSLELFQVNSNSVTDIEIIVFSSFWHVRKLKLFVT